MKNRSVFVGVDLGGSRIKLVAVTPSGEIIEKTAIETNDATLPPPEKIEYWITTIRSHIELLEKRHAVSVTGVGLGAPGLVPPGASAIQSMPGRLEGLVGLEWRSALQLPVPVELINDSHAALLGEAWIGSAREYRDVVLLTLGTGVGGAAMIDGRLLRGRLGRAAHFGHMSLDLDGTPDICRMPGSIEWFVGDASVCSRSGGRFSSNRELLEACGRGDPEAASLWNRSMSALACAIASLVNAFDPEAVVLSGGLTEEWERIETTLKGCLDIVEWRPYGNPVSIYRAMLGSFSGAVGAARHAYLTAEGNL